MKVIFLDIDGVLNTGAYIESAFKALKIAGVNAHESNAVHDENGHQFDPIAIRMLKWIIKETDAKIVISSTWRGNGLAKMQKLWKDRDLPGEVIDITPFHRGNGRDHLPFKERAERGGEIKEWLDNHPEVTAYLIFDDDDDMLPSQENNFVQTNATYGITASEAARGIHILTGKKDEVIRNPKNGRSFEDYELEINRKTAHVHVLQEENKKLRFRREEIQADIRNKLSPMKTLSEIVVNEHYKDSGKVEIIMKETATLSLECIEYIANILIVTPEKIKNNNE